MIYNKQYFVKQYIVVFVYIVYTTYTSLCLFQ